MLGIRIQTPGYDLIEGIPPAEAEQLILNFNIHLSSGRQIRIIDIVQRRIKRNSKSTEYEFFLQEAARFLTLCRNETKEEFRSSKAKRQKEVRAKARIETSIKQLLRLVPEDKAKKPFELEWRTEKFCFKEEVLPSDLFLILTCFLFYCRDFSPLRVQNLQYQKYTYADSMMKLFKSLNLRINNSDKLRAIALIWDSFLPEERLSMDAWRHLLERGYKEKTMFNI